MAPAGHTAETEVTGHHGTEPDPQRFTPTSTVSGESIPPMPETAVTALSPLACTDDASVGQMADDAPAPAESASGGGDCISGEQQGTVLPFGHDQSLLCMTPGCHRRRRVYCDNAYSSPHHLGSTCCVGCEDAALLIRARSDHSPTCCEVGPQPLQGIHGHLVYPVPSLAVQRLIAPPRRSRRPCSLGSCKTMQLAKHSLVTKSAPTTSLTTVTTTSRRGRSRPYRNSARMTRTESRDGATVTWYEMATHW